MKTPSDSLHLLITSLTPQEKKYFRHFATRHISEKQTVYLKLFDSIEAQHTYDEKEIKEKFKNEAFIQQLFVAKNYLHEMVLQSLAAFHNESTKASELMNMLSYIDILFDKGLYELCDKIISKAEKLAEATENFPLQLEIINRKLNIIRTTALHKFSEEELNEVFNSKNEVLKKIENLNSFERLNIQLLAKVNKKGWFTRSEEEIKKDYLPIIENELFHDEKSANSLSSTLLFHSTLSSCFYIMGEKEKSYQHSIKIVKLFEKHPEMVKSNPSEYIQSISRLVFILVSMGKFKEGLDYIEKAKEVKVNSALLNGIMISSIRLNEIIIYNIIGELKKGIEMVPVLEEQFNIYNKNISKTDICYFYYNFSCLYFKNREFEKASEYLFKLINDRDIQYLPHIQGNVRILNLMVQFELNNIDMLPHLIRSTYRFLLKQQRLFKFETLLLKFIKQLPGIVESEFRNEFKKLRDALKELKLDPYEKNALDFFAVEKWLDSKIQRNG